MQFDASLSNVQGSTDSFYQDGNDNLKDLRKRLANEQGKFMYCLKDLGLICAYEVKF